MKFESEKKIENLKNNVMTEIFFYNEKLWL